jgi:hypothetical protein
MIDIEYTSDSFRTTDEQASEVRAWRGRYNGLVTILGNLGTQVLVRRTIETDRDVAPHRFVRNAVHEYIFPPQETTVAEDRSEVTDATSGYSLHHEEVVREYDETQVISYLRMNYDDSNGRVEFGIKALKGESDLPHDVATAISEVEASSFTAE